MANLSIEFELKEANESEKLEKHNIKQKTKNVKLKSKESIKNHHGNRKYEKIAINSYDKVDFSTGNPSVEIKQGILHLYKQKYQQANNSVTVCMLSIPSIVSCAEILDFCRPCSNMISNIKILNTNSPSIFMTLIRFKTHEYAELFFKKFNGKQLTSDNPSNICNLAFVQSITYSTTAQGGFRSDEDSVELPYCPICLERMDESLGILTILCDHSFHMECISKWPDLKCPICRCIQSPTTMETCSCCQCDSTTDLWLCLICGNLGCSRYSNRHALQHFIETAHTFAMKIGTTQVWDYAGDYYVHRLISATGGKFVECSNELQESLDNKIESLKLEYDHLLSFQLINQREFFERKIDSLKISHQNEVKHMKEVHQNELKKLKSCLNNKKKNVKINDQKKLEEEKLLNDSLLSNQHAYQEKLKNVESAFDAYKLESKAKIKDLEDQISDLVSHLQITSNIEKMDSLDKEAISKGSISINNK